MTVRDQSLFQYCLSDTLLRLGWVGLQLKSQPSGEIRMSILFYGRNCLVQFIDQQGWATLTFHDKLAKKQYLFTPRNHEHANDQKAQVNFTLYIKLEYDKI